MLEKEVGLRIKQLRAEKNLSQEDLANSCSLDRTYINSVENGRRNITIDSLNKIAVALGVSLHDFFDFSSLDSQKKFMPLTRNLSLLNLKVGDTYSNKELIKIFSCSNSGGIRVNIKRKTITLITHHESIINPYKDQGLVDGKFVYTGMGQKGDQEIKETNQNGKIAFSRTNGYTMYYFVCEHKNEYIYMGEAVLNGQPYYVDEKDLEDNVRKVVKFPMRIK